jgi:hypothetical protein
LSGEGKRAGGRQKHSSLARVELTLVSHDDTLTQYTALSKAKSLFN